MEKRKDTKTTIVKSSETTKSWYVVDAAGKTLGRLSSEVAKILRGKHKVTYTPHVAMGDGVIVINAEKVRLTGAKKGQKIYRYYTGYISGMREIPFENMMARKPNYIIEHAIKGMMPRTRLGKKQLKSLRIVKGDSYETFESQKPILLDI
ncbi:ribosomal protein L13 [Chlamydia pneumoniae TW-183]|uniref:Large ribosomal subunit protein uL13 n=3 Tax=Chlamydia pneumoniae TaxID=83558 RepID=RL13_CHLPN|nr:50S ribosomal protein L13 [Chlamydia pneumoniae]Q9Z8T7.1 RecName: Full=Large ribosomal subunit protein uL13; AltName: Full=50S ribosomal protein L13 [Chlamydia pneumoniae]AAD18400.1 L13 Ribosomal Protein [Chlamydia pneumoniae CWL029]AAF38342.1 ribosomal protein L13 [Chlamydia pneumoniae AR39]AAP98187.1 ribosomal protein L13 [Chlamydia pneumoniae TW-183]CRI32747.1 50S ribosomal protein L13 [Chlamydia pneumoniae]CRI35610.1 50S ribosomal protein L13 [Chlamydia pneumoniae]